MRTEDFNFELPETLIAQFPQEKRENSRLMVLDRSDQSLSHRRFYQIDEYLSEGDVLVLNNTKVFNARLYAYKDTGAKVELFLLEQKDNDRWICLAKPAKRLRVGDRLRVSDTFYGTVLEKTDKVLIRFEYDGAFFDCLDQHGEPPLPPYIQPENPSIFKERYQTVFAKTEGSVAAPTAGLHFSETLLERLREKGVLIESVTLHVGYGTFKPVSAEKVEDHHMHAETYYLDEAVASRLTQYKAEKRRIIAVGTTSARTLESSFQDEMFVAGEQESRLFIYPGYRYQAVDGLVTNFHLPKSSLIMLVSALAGKSFTFDAYREAIKKNYRFYSFGDAMLIL